MAVMGVPEAAMDENGSLEFRENDIGRSGEVADVEPKAQAQTMEGLAEEQLGAGVLRTNACHNP
jgi:hypothetical protein